MDQIKLTPKSALVLRFLQANEGQYFGDEIAAEIDLNPRGIHGVLNSLVKNKLVEKAEAERTVMVDGKEKVKVGKIYSLTDAGLDFDVDAAVITG